jgi:polyhydroxyalkanoate synthesis repressor PhaR
MLEKPADKAQTQTQSQANGQTSGQPHAKPADKREPVVVKKYANRRLYNTETSTYVTLDDLAAMVKAERDFVVFDAKSGDDLTHTVLTQIIVEQESRVGGAGTMLPIPFLRQLIRFYGDSIGKMVPSYLQVSLDTLTREQSRVREQFTSVLTPVGALEAYQEHARKNLAMFEQAMSMFSPFGTNAAQKAAAHSSAAAHAAATANTPAAPGTTANVVPMPASTPLKPAIDAAAKPAANLAESQLAEMQVQLKAMQAMIDKMAKDRG